MKTSFAVLVLCGAVALALSGFGVLALPLSINVDLGDGRQAELAVADNEDLVQAAANFCDRNGISRGFVGQLVAALEAQSQARGATSAVGGTPLLSLPVNVAGRRANLEYFDGEIPEDAARAHLVARGLQDDPALDRHVTMLANQIRKDLAGSGVVPPSPAVTTVSVDVDVDGNLYPLNVHEGETPAQAAAKFVTDLKLGTESIGVLVQAIQRKLEARRASAPPLFTLDITVDGAVRPLAYFDGQDATAAARTFCQTNGVTDEIGCGSVRTAILSRLNSIRQAAEPSALASLSVLIGNTSYDLEFDPRTTRAVDLARKFCVQEWSSIQSVLMRDLGQMEVSLNDCTNVLSGLMDSEMRKQGV